MKKTSTAADPFYIAVGKAIRSAREHRMTQEQMGASVGLSRTSINNIENGRQKILLDTFCKIAKTLGKEPAALLSFYMGNETHQLGMDKRLRGLVPEEQQFIQEGIAEARRKK